MLAGPDRQPVPLRFLAVRALLTGRKRHSRDCHRGGVGYENEANARVMRAVTLWRQTCRIVGARVGGRAGAVASLHIETATLSGLGARTWLTGSIADIPGAQIADDSNPPPLRQRADPKTFVLQTRLSKNPPDADRDLWPFAGGGDRCVK